MDVVHVQCDQIWRNFATLAKHLSIWQFLTVYFFFGKMLSILCQICDIIVLFSLMQMAKNIEK